MDDRRASKRPFWVTLCLRPRMRRHQAVEASWILVFFAAALAVLAISAAIVPSGPDHRPAPGLALEALLLAVVMVMVSAVVGRATWWVDQHGRWD